MKNQKVSLFEINKVKFDLMDLIEEREGELTPEMEAALEINQEQLSQKGESYVFVLEQLHAWIETNKRYKEQADRNIKRATKTMDKLKGSLLSAVKIHGEFDAGIHKISTRKSTSLNVLDEALIPKKICLTTVTTALDKKSVTDMIKSGKKVNGAELSVILNLAIK